MFAQLQERRIQANNDFIQIYEIPRVGGKRIYSFVYANEDTRRMDLAFGLNGSTVRRDSQIYNDLIRSTGPGSLGSSEVEFVLRYFASVAAQGGRFVGLREEEIKKCFENPNSIVKVVDLEKTLNHSDKLAGGVTYLTRVEVEGTKVLFPRNLRRLVF